MACQTQPQPALLSGTRRFGRYETFNRFDNLSSGHASVGSKCLGKMTVDCQFLFKKSRWGVLTENCFPAGIIYLDLNFGPPQGCRVKNATITITLDEDDKALHSFKHRAGRKFHESMCPVHMTDWYGPKQLAGAKKSTESKRTVRLTPEVHVLGNGAGGLGIDKERIFSYSSRWSFNGQLLPSKGSWTYKTLKWDLTECELGDQTFRSSRIHTAFAFEHSGQPFLMNVEIHGKLEKWTNRVKSKLKFGSNEDEGQTTTLIDFEHLDSFRTRLDELAMSLPRAMEMENYEEIPIEIPDTIPAAFHPLSTQTTAPDSLTEPSQKKYLQQGTTGNITNLSNVEHPAIIGGVPDPVVEELLDLELASLKNAAYALTRPQEQKAILEPPETLSGSSTTAVDPEEEIQEGMQKSSIKAESLEDFALDRASMDQQVMVKILQIPAVLVFLQLIARLMHIFGSGSGRKPTVSS